MKLTRKCPQCSKIINITVNIEDHTQWTGGALAQDAFPYLTASERESLISGICNKCWDNLFLVS